MDRTGALTFYDAALLQDHLAFGTPSPHHHGTPKVQSAIPGECSFRTRDSRREGPSEGRNSGSKFTRSAVSTITSYATGPTDKYYSTELNSINSPFLRLPAEIKIMIFTHIFSGKRYIFQGRKGCLVSCAGSFTQMDMSLLLVSRQAHADTALLPYKLGRIYFLFDGSYQWGQWNQSIEKFLKKRSVKQIKAIVSLQAHVESYDHRWAGQKTGVWWAKKLGV